MRPKIRKKANGTKWYQKVPYREGKGEYKERNKKEKNWLSDGFSTGFSTGFPTGFSTAPSAPEALAPQPPPGEPVSFFPSDDSGRRRETDANAYEKEDETEGAKKARLLRQLRNET